MSEETKNSERNPAGASGIKKKKQTLWRRLRGWLYLAPFAVFLGIYAGLFSDRYRVVPGKDYYLHYNLATFKVDKILIDKHRLVVFRKGKIVRGVGGRFSCVFKTEGKGSVEKFPIPWDGPDGF